MGQAERAPVDLGGGGPGPMGDEQGQDGQLREGYEEGLQEGQLGVTFLVITHPFGVMFNPDWARCGDN